MRFYYVSDFSLLAYSIVCFIAIGLLWLLWTKVFKWRLSSPGYWVLVAAILVAPWTEELQIAYNFDQLCRKDAGISIAKTVEVDGFYDDTSHWWRQLAESNYRFVESRDQTSNTFWRVERGDSGIRHFKIDKPTARYHFKSAWSAQALQVAHKIWREEANVVDTQTGEQLGQYVRYSRGPYWFYIGLGIAPHGCDGPDGGPNTKHSSLIYKQVLMPAK